MALTKTEVSKLYVAIFNRASEGNGNTYWQDQGDLAEVATKMLATPDAASYFGDSLNDDKAFIEWIYKNTLNKTYADDASGIDYWVSELASGKTRGQVVADLVTAATDPANAGPAQDQFHNRVTVSDYVADHVPEVPEDYKTALGFDGDLVVTNLGQTVIDSIKYVDQTLAAGETFKLTTDVDVPELTDKSDTIIAESSSVLGPDDKIIDTSVKDHDVMNLTVQADTPAFTALNIEEINVTLETMGGNTIDASNITGSTISVAADPAQIGFTGAATIANLGDNNAVAGDGITDFTVNGVKGGLIDTGSATSLTTASAAATDSLNLKINGDVSLTATAHKDLNVETTADATLTLGGTIFSGDGVITGKGDLTVKTATSTFDTANDAKTLDNQGTGKLAIELTDSAVGVDLTGVDANDVITDVAFTQNIEFTNTLDVTAKATANTMTLTDATPAGTGGSAGTQANIHLTKAGTLATDSYTFVDVDEASIEAQQGGGIAQIDTGSANLTLNTAKDLTLTNLIASGQGVVVDAASAGKLTITNMEASALNAKGFTKDLTVTEAEIADTHTSGANTDATASQITVLGGTAKNSITLATQTAAATVVTQDDKDTITAVNTTGKLTIDSAGGDDTVSAIAMTTSVAQIDLGAGKDTLTVQNADATGDATVNAGADDDTVLVLDTTAGKMVVNGDAGNDIVDLQAKITGGANVGGGKLAATADVTVNGADGNDTVKINAATADTATITIDGGDGTDIVEVTKDADFTNTTLTLSTIENLKIDTAATFTDDQLNDQTFAVTSGTAAVDILTVNLNASTATDSENTTNLSTLDFSASSSTEVEYVNINATASLSDDIIKGAHNSTNVIDLGAASGKETVQLFADAIGTTIDNLQTGATQPDVTSSMLTGIDTTKTTFDVAVINHFETADDSLILGDAATSTNYKAISVDAFNGSAAPDAGVEEYLANAIEGANTELGNDSNLEYVYVYNSDATTANPNTKDAWLLWDSDGNHSIDAAILLVGVEPDPSDGSGFAASDIVAG